VDRYKDSFTFFFETRSLSAEDEERLGSKEFDSEVLQRRFFLQEMKQQRNYKVHVEEHLGLFHSSRNARSVTQ
jgi:hypothetical protein